ncbi:hypothetical protein VPHD530_0031 [Vibrio phage D530]
MSLVVKVIKKLKAAAANLQAWAIAGKTRKLEVAAMRIDEEQELAAKRVEFSLELQAKLEERAFAKLETGIERANSKKAKVGKELDELAAL